MEVPGTPQEKVEPPARCDSEADVVFYMEEPRAGICILFDACSREWLIFLPLRPGDPSRARRGERESVRGNIFVSQTSSVTEAPSDEIDCDIDAEPPRVTT